MSASLSTGGDPDARVTLRLFASARHAAGTGRASVAARTVGDVLEWARGEYGRSFSDVLGTSRVWCNGQPADLDTVLSDGDEVAVLPPVSGGSSGLSGQMDAESGPRARQLR